MLKRILPLLSTCLLAAAATLELRNDFLLLEVEPTGGRIRRLAWTAAPSENLTAEDGLLGDHFHHPEAVRGFLTQRPYELERAGDAVRMTARHSGGGIDFLRLGKTVTLKPGETVAGVRYEFHNLAAAMADNEYGFWCQNFVNPDGNVSFFFPEMGGIARVPVKSAGADFAYYRRPSRGWCGFAREAGGGLAFAMDYALLQQFYGWYGKRETTQEFYFDKLRIPAGKSVATEVELIAFHTLTRISGAGGGLVGDLSLSAEGGNSGSQAVALRLYSGRAQTVRLVFTARRLREGKPVAIHERTVVFPRAAAVQAIRFSHVFREYPAIFDIECRAYGPDGKLLAIFNAPLGLGASLISYRMKPQGERAGKRQAEINLRGFDASRATPHIEWAKPLAGGRIRLTAITPYQSWREVAELAQRMDAEVRSSLFLAQGRPQNASGDYFGLLSEADITSNLNDLLQQECDVILLAGVHLDKLTEAQRREIVRKVENGCGLVLVGCSAKNARELDALSPLALDSKVRSYPRAVPRKARDGFPAAAIPWSLIPAATCLPCVAKGEVLATVGGLPYAAMRDHGKGRVVALSLLTNGGGGRMVGGLSPELPYPLPGALFREYQECYQLLYAKLIAAAARRDQGCHFATVGVSRQGAVYTVKLTLANAPAGGDGLSLALFSRNRDNEELARAVHAVQPISREQSFRLPARAWNGQTLIGLVLRNARGEVLDFGAVSADRLPMARIHSLKADKGHYQEGEEAVFQVAAAVEQRPAELRWRLEDAHGRVVHAGRATAENAVSFRVPVRSGVPSRHYRCVCEMVLAGAVVDRHAVKFTATPAPEKLRWDDFEVGIWITPYSYDALRPWLRGFFAEPLRRMHVRTIMGNSRMVDHDFALSQNFHPTCYQASGMRPARVPDEYARTGDKRLLVRRPCLSSPAFREGVRRQFRELGEREKPFANRFYWFGDELSLTGYWSSAIDFCFSQDCLRGFRDFLRQKYGTVEQAAAQWGVPHRSFDDFLPETYAGGRRRRDGNYSAWADHLEFMDRLLCDYIRAFCDKGLYLGDPAAVGCISGPQAPSAYGGNDWALQSKAHRGLMSYSFGGLDEILRSFHPQLVDIPWVLGYAHYDGAVCYNLWKALQRGAHGAMGFSMASLVRPDGTLSRSGQAVADYMPEIAAGIGKLVLNPLRERPAPEVLLLYSQPSIRAAYIRGGAKRHENLRLKYIDLCRNFGVPFRFVSDEELAAGALPPSARLLVLADAAALGDAALHRLAEFQQAGGTLLVDGGFAEMDASCRVRAPRPLAAEVAAKAVRLPGEDSYHELFSKAAALRTAEEAASLARQRGAFARLLRQARITPFCTLERADGTPFLEAEIEILRDPQGNRFVLAVCKETVGTQVTPRFAAPGVARDIRGRGTFLKNDNPLFFALLPAEETQPMTAAATAGEGAVAIRIDAHVPRDTVVHVTVRDPSGRAVAHYAANLPAPGGRAEWRHTPALNDAPGVWTAAFREVVGGKTATAHFTVPAAAP